LFHIARVKPVTGAKSRTKPEFADALYDEDEII